MRTVYQGEDRRRTEPSPSNGEIGDFGSITGARPQRQMRIFRFAPAESGVRKGHGAELSFRHNPVFSLGGHVSRDPAWISEAHEAEQARVCGCRYD